MRFPTKRGSALAALALLAILATACGSNAAATGTGEEETRRVTASPPDHPRLVVGDKAITADNGTTLTVLSYESPLAFGEKQPKRGFEFSGIDVSGCAGPDSENSLMHVGPEAFALRLEDGTRLPPEDTKVKRPALQNMNPLPGECDRGFVTFQTPQDERPELVVYDEQFVLEKSIAWKVPEGR